MGRSSRRSRSRSPDRERSKRRRSRSSERSERDRKYRSRDYKDDRESRSSSSRRDKREKRRRSSSPHSDDERDKKVQRVEVSSNSSDNAQQLMTNNTTGAVVQPNVTNDTASKSSDEEKRRLRAAKLEAWKKKAEEEKLLQKLKEEEQKVKETTEKVALTLASNSSGSTSSNNALAPFASHSSSRKAISSLDFSLDMEDDKPQTKEVVDEEEDPLDAFMKQINNQLPTLPEVEQVAAPQVITLEDLEQQNTEETFKEDEEAASEEYYKTFMEELKKPKEKKMLKEVEDNGSSTSSKKEEMFYSDDESDDDVKKPTSVGEADNSELKNKKDLKPVDHSLIEYPAFRKNFYIVPKEFAKLTQAEQNDLRRDISVKVHGRDVPPPVQNWTQCGLNDTTLQAIQHMKYDKPFPIQAQAIPCIMSGRNIIGIAKTGSGKTLAFVMPMIRHVLDQPDIREGDGPIALIIVPTRELALQIYAEVKKFAKPVGLRAVCAYGGASIAEQIAMLKRGAHIVVCTPGRMIDLLCANRGRVTNLYRATYVVIDEADRMFDLGFEPQITKIVNNIRPDRQLVMFSATFPKPLEALARKFLKDSVEIIAGGKSVACDTVKQYVEIRTEEGKFLRLLELLGKWTQKGLVLVFVDKQTEVGNLYKDLLGASYDALTLHGGMDQMDRDATIQSFKKQEKLIMIATSVLARGLDIPEIQLVINYNVPNHYEDYVHRVGRTGRAGRTGTAFTFLTPEEERYAPDLVKALKQSGNEVPPELHKMANDFKEKKKKGMVDKYPRALGGFGGRGYKFDEAESNKKKEEIKRQMKTLGMEDEIEEEEAAENTEMFENDSAATATTQSVSGTQQAGVPSSMATAPAATSTSAGSSSATDADALLVNIAKAQAFAATLSIQQHNVKPDHFSEEIEINDYPQMARWKVTHKDALYEIQEYTGCTVTTKGMHVEPGRPAPPGQRKLYLLVEASSKENLDRAKIMIMRTLNEGAAMAAASSAPRPTGRYKVV